LASGCSWKKAPEHACPVWLARGFRELLKKDVKTVRKELDSIQDAEKRIHVLEAFDDLCSILGLED
jgi:hypothetical protein